MSDPDDQPRYRLEGMLADGKTCEVWRARCQELTLDVAVKVLRVRRPEDEELFVREALVTAQLQHPGVPPLFNVGLLPDGRPYFAMKLIKGVTLAQLLGEQGLGVGKWLGVLESVCQTVAYADACGIVHCNLEPSNVMIGTFGEVQVLDWWLAKLLPGEHNRNDRPDAGKATTRDAHPAYMSPEQATGDLEAITPRSDVFALGAILCHLLTDSPPYIAPDPTTLRRMAVHAELTDAFRRLDTSRAAKELVKLCKRCLSAIPAGRPATAAEVACAISEFRARGSRGFLGWLRKILGGTSV